MSNCITPLSLKDAPALIERLLPVQKLSAEVFKERKAGAGQTLTPLGAYWKGRKPLILSQACVLASLLPATNDPKRDLEIFEKLMAMDDESFVARWPRRRRPKEILAVLSLACISDYFIVSPPGVLPELSPVDWSKPEYAAVQVEWREDLSELERRRLEVQMLPRVPYRQKVEAAKRPKEVMDIVHDHIWDVVNVHVGTNAHSFPELVEQLGVMRFGHRPCVADTFCGSGQIPFEAARLGCDVYASDLNPVACMLTWGALHIVGGSQKSRAKLECQQTEVVTKVLAEIDALGVETDGKGWRAKSYLYCLEVRCPQSGWIVPLLPSRILSYGKQAIADLIPDGKQQRYNVVVRSSVSPEEMANAAKGTVCSDGRGQDPYLIHTVDGVEYRTKISTLRGDFRRDDGSTGNKLRLWERSDFKPCPDDIFQERLYAVNWMRPKSKGKKFDYEFRTVTGDDLRRERIVEEFVGKHLAEWQQKGWIPDMRIEPGYNTDQPIRERGWTHWHHLFPPRHLLILGLLRRFSDHGGTLLRLSRVLDYTSKLCQWTTSKAGSSKPGEGKRTGGASDNPSHVFYNQAINTFLNYGCRASLPILNLVLGQVPAAPVHASARISCKPASDLGGSSDLYITDPPYGDAVNYDELLEFFIAWLRKNPPPEFADWVWDSRRSLAIKGSDEDFRRGMVAAYKRMTECMPDNGLQVIMFTHQSGSDMTAEAIRPRVRGETTFVDGLIAFAVDTANQCLVPSGIAKIHWDGLSGAERFYLKLVDLEARGLKTLDNYQNFAKAFKVRDFRALMASQRANQARLKSAVEFGKTEMSDSSELHQSVLRAVLYAMMELVKNVDSDEALAHLRLNVPDYYANQTQRDLVVELAETTLPENLKPLALTKPAPPASCATW